MSISISRKSAKCTRRKENKAVFFPDLCVLMSLREIVYFFRPSCAVGQMTLRADGAYPRAYRARG
jgi:hypothetical protein